MQAEKGVNFNNGQDIISNRPLPLIKLSHILNLMIIFIYLFLNFIGVQLIYNVVLVLGVQQRDSVIHIHIFILFQILFSYRLSENAE